jgi:hypothetical protein
MVQWGLDNWGLIATVLFGISEALSLIPWFKSNGVFQFIFELLKKFAPKKEVK